MGESIAPPGANALATVALLLYDVLAVVNVANQDQKNQVIFKN